MKSLLLIVLFFHFCGSAMSQDYSVQILNKLNLSNKSEVERSKAIVHWIVDNIQYDYVEAKEWSEGKRRMSARSVQEVILSKKGICADLANVAKELFNLAGIKCEVVNGLVKGEINTAIDKFNENLELHAWNVIFINNSWYLLDCTDAINSVERKRNFDCRLTFMAQPEKFIFSHYPDDPKWQLLEKPIDKETFKKLPVYYFNAACLYSDTSSPIPKRINANLQSKNGKVQFEEIIPISTIAFIEAVSVNDESLLYDDLPFKLNEDGRTIKVDFEYKGKYYLNIFKKSNNQSNKKINESYLFATLLVASD